MNKRNIRKLLLTAVVAVVLLAAFGLVSKPGTPANADNVFSLRAPLFVDVARAEIAAISSFLDDEAGIAAYTQTPGSIDLSVVRDEFRTIERETAEYIIGSVGIPDYSEDHDPHVYVHTDGWVLAYYLAAEQASYIIDLRHYDGDRKHQAGKRHERDSHCNWGGVLRSNLLRLQVSQRDSHHAHR